MIKKTAGIGALGYSAIGGLGGLAGGLMGGGTGLLLRSRLEERHKEDKDKTTKDRLIAYAPVIGGTTGALLGGTRAVLKTKQILDMAFKNPLATNKQKLEALKEYADRHGIKKNAALKKDVSLREHQKKLIEQLHQNDGSLLVAHATGVGKTLGGIAAFEDLRAKGKATRALVVVPASLRSNFVDNGIKKFTNSTVATYGPKGEAGTKNIGEKSQSIYNVVSYDLFREHGPSLIEATGADTLIMDEVHRARATEGVTYNKLRDLRPNFKNVITLTGSVVNNDPNEIVPLLDITYGPTGHKLVSPKFFDKLFVQKDAVVKGGFLFNAKTEIQKKLKNKPQLAKYLAGKVSYIPHEAVEELLPKKNLEVIKVPMSKEQKHLYDFALSAVDPVTRWKLRNNLPIGQKEAQDAFSQLLKARQVATDPGIVSKDLAALPDPATYSPKIKAIVEDLQAHLDSDPSNKSVIYGNLLEGQLKSVQKSLKARGIEHTTFFGVGNEGNSAKKRTENIKDFQNGKNRVLLISGAGAEGLDLKNANLLQMVEGHYNPERIHQAESRVRRMGSPLKEISVKRYVSIPVQTNTGALIKGFLSKTPIGGNTGVDEWVYSIAKRKDDINKDFRDVLDHSGKGASSLQKSASKEDVLSPKEVEDMYDYQRGIEAFFRKNTHAHNNYMRGHVFGGLFSEPLFALSGMRKRTDESLNAKLKQILLDKGEEELTNKKHFPKVLAESKLDEKAIDATKGVEMLLAGYAIHSGLKGIESSTANLLPAVTLAANNYKPPKLGVVSSTLSKGLEKAIPSEALKKSKNSFFRALGHVPKPLLATGLAGATAALATPFAKDYMRRGMLTKSISPDSKDLDIGIQKYKEKLRKKYESKYKSSKGFVNEYETKKELGIDSIE